VVALADRLRRRGFPLVVVAAERNCRGRTHATHAKTHGDAGPDGPTVFVEVNEEDTSLATLYKSAVHGRGRVNSRDVAGTLHGCDFRGALAATNVDLVCDGTRARALGDG